MRKITNFKMFFGLRDENRSNTVILHQFVVERMFTGQVSLQKTCLCEVAVAFAQCSGSVRIFCNGHYQAIMCENASFITFWLFLDTNNSISIWQCSKSPYLKPKFRIWVWNSVAEGHPFMNEEALDRNNGMEIYKVKCSRIGQGTGLSD